MQYLYMTCCDRTIDEPILFPTLNDARKEMETDFLNMVDEEDITDYVHETGKLKRDENGLLHDIESESFQLSDTFAWANDCGKQHVNWDAKIIPMSHVHAHENTHNYTKKTCIFMECTEFDRLINTLYPGHMIETEYCIDCMSIIIDRKEIDDKELYDKIAEHYQLSTVRSIHTDTHDPVGVWIEYTN